MNINDFLTSRKPELVKKWTALVLDTYESSTFFKTQKDPIANPVGANISAALNSLFDLLCRGAEPRELAGPLDTIVRIRAVQDFSPSEAVSFPFMLKNLIRQEMAKASGEELSGLAEFETAVDRVALEAFDIYMACRERLFQIRLNEYKNGTHVLTDGTQCASAWLKRKLEASAEKNQHNSLT